MNIEIHCDHKHELCVCDAVPIAIENYANDMGKVKEILDMFAILELCLSIDQFDCRST